MKAALCTAYNAPDAIRIAEIPTPTPKPDEVLIRIHASGVSSGDWRIQSASFPLGFAILGRLLLGWSRPRQPILGTALSGVVAATGAAVIKFKPGDAVIGFPGARLGGHADYICMQETAALALKPSTLSFPEAAALAFGGSTALHFLITLGKLQKGERVLINGASGAVGSAAVSLARHFGAEVTGVASSANQALVKSLGAQQVIDYTTTDYATTGQTWDLILDTVGPDSLRRQRSALSAAGRILLVNTDLPHMLTAALTNLFSRQKALAGVAPESAAALETLAALAQSGQFKPLIDRTLPFDQIRAAYAVVASQHKRGSVQLDHMT